MRVLALALALTLFVAVPLPAQQIAVAHVTVHVPELMALDVVSHDPAWRRTRSEGEAQGAVRIRVSANRSWKVMVSGADEAGVAPVWVRLASATSSAVAGAREFLRISGVRTELARGGPGGEIEVVLDYRWAARSLTDLAAAVPVYTLVAN